MSRSRKRGRRRKFSNGHQLYQKATEYLDICEQEKRLPSIAGLCLALGFTSRHGLERYQKHKGLRPNFANAINRILLRIETLKAEVLLATENASKQRAIIFDLTNNHGWSVRHSGESRSEPGGEQPAVQQVSDMEAWMNQYEQIQAARSMAGGQGP